MVTSLEGDPQGHAGSAEPDADYRESTDHAYAYENNTHQGHGLRKFLPSQKLVEQAERYDQTEQREHTTA